MELWGIDQIDRAVSVLVYFALVALVVLLASVAFDIGVRHWSRAVGHRRMPRLKGQYGLVTRNSKEIISILLVIGGIWLAHATLRNQAKLEVETRISDQAYHVLSMETDGDGGFVRCMYVWWAYEDVQGCLDRVVSDESSWSYAMLYVEESLSIFNDAGDLYDKYGSDYWEDIAYWADDIGRDPTGLFSYYILNRYPDGRQATRYLSDAGICIPNLCTGYLRVSAALGSNARPESTKACEGRTVSMDCRPGWRVRAGFKEAR